MAGPPSLYSSRKLLEGYKDAHRKHKCPLIDELIICYDLNLEKVKIYVKFLLDLAEAPDALFAVNDPTALEALKVIKERACSFLSKSRLLASATITDQP